jgi:hypothetical protein
VSKAHPPPAPVVVSVRPEPDSAVLAAIVAAVEESWPRPRPVDNVRTKRPVWRFSGRWWTQPAAMSRRRPVVGH